MRSYSVPIMHEASITTHLLNLAIRHATATHARRITCLYLVVGQLSSMVDESVEFYWDIISQGTIAEGSQLHFRRIPARFQCSACQTQYELSDSDSFACPVCGGEAIRAITGDEFYLESIDIETKDDLPVRSSGAPI